MVFLFYSVQNGQLQAVYIIYTVNMEVRRFPHSRYRQGTFHSSDLNMVHGIFKAQKPNYQAYTNVPTRMKTHIVWTPIKQFWSTIRILHITFECFFHLLTFIVGTFNNYTFSSWQPYFISIIINTNKHFTHTVL